MNSAPQPAVEHAALLSVIYTSTATVRFSEIDLALLLAVSRSNNASRDITGVLLSDRGRFVQVLEGPEGAVRAALATIQADPRHTDVDTLVESRPSERRFGSWAMGYRSMSDAADADRAWLGSPEALRSTEGSRIVDLLERFRGA